MAGDSFNNSTFERFKRETVRSTVEDDLGSCCMISPTSCNAPDVEDGANAVQTFQYVFSAVRSWSTPEKFTFLFVGNESWQLQVTGRNLRAVYDRIADHRLRRLTKADRDFGQDDGKPVITGITVTDVTPQD